MESRDIEVRADSKKKNVIKGYAAVWNSESVDLGFFTETVLPGAFARSIREGADVRALVDHVPSKILGRTKADTLKLEEDNKGLYIEIDPLPDTQLARDLVENMRMGNISQMSFGFYVREDRWSIKNGKDHREIVDADLFDVSIVTYPAYPATVAEVSEARSLKDVFDSRTLALEEDKKSDTSGPTLKGYWDYRHRWLMLDCYSAPPSSIGISTK